MLGPCRLQLVDDVAGASVIKLPAEPLIFNELYMVLLPVVENRSFFTPVPALSVLAYNASLKVTPFAVVLVILSALNILPPPFVRTVWPAAPFSVTTPVPLVKWPLSVQLPPTVMPLSCTAVVVMPVTPDLVARNNVFWPDTSYIELRLVLLVALSSVIGELSQVAPVDESVAPFAETLLLSEVIQKA